MLYFVNDQGRREPVQEGTGIGGDRGAQIRWIERDIAESRFVESSEERGLARLPRSRDDDDRELADGALEHGFQRASCVDRCQRSSNSCNLACQMQNCKSRFVWSAAEYSAMMLRRWLVPPVLLAALAAGSAGA